MTKIAFSTSIKIYSQEEIIFFSSVQTLLTTNRREGSGTVNKNAVVSLSSVQQLPEHDTRSARDFRKKKNYYTYRKG